MVSRKLLNFSGGIDSTYCLYQALKEGEHLLVHHIHLINYEKRAPLERVAVTKTRAWLATQRLPGKYKYIESTFDFGSLGHRVLDVNVWAFFTGVILAGKQNQDIDGVIVPRHAEAFIHEPDPIAAAARSDNFLRVFMNTIAHKEVPILLPIVNMMKEDIIKAMPRELLDKCWWCRRPVRNKPCHKCITCVQVDPVLRRIRNG